MPLWGSKNNDSFREAEPQDDAETRPADEHTRLLPNRLNSDRPIALSPDDPAVSPYNLWSVRFMRWITLLFTILTFLWWVLLLVSDFVTPPGLHTRGSGFFAFSYTSIALTTLFFTLVFFSAPSQGVRILSMVMAAVLLIDTILIVVVGRVRSEEGWVGTASVIWALLMSLWALITDRTVKWGKAEEEERLTGRAETRRTMSEWAEVTTEATALGILLAALVLITSTLILRSLDAGLSPPGERYWVDGGKYQIHVYCYGNKTDVNGVELPTVLLEGGEEPVERGLQLVADAAVKNGSISRYCFADRPGYAWSDTAPSPLSAGMAEDAVSEALAQAGEHGPWVLAGAGYGTLHTRIFSSRHGREVTGMLLIDPLHEDLLRQIGAPGRGFLFWLRGVISPLGFDRLSGALFKGRNAADRIYGRSAKQGGKYFFVRLQENLVAESLSRRDVTSSRIIQYPDTPLVLISSGEQLRRDSAWESQQRDLSHLTNNLKHWDIVGNAPHHIWKTFEGREMIEKRLRQLVYA